jgi:reductive dehalogenase
MNLILITIGVILAVFMISFAIVSLRENEPRAAKRAFLLALPLPLPFLILGISGVFWQSAPALLTIVSALLLALTFGTGLVLLLPIGNRLIAEKETPHNRIDERDIMFSRNLLQVDTERYGAYYAANPDKLKLDDNFRNRPGLMQKEALYYDPFTTSAAEASFKTVAAFHALLDEEELAEQQIQIDPAKMSDFIKRWAGKLGAISSGITDLKEYHLYSTIGRGERYGQAVELDHAYAIALTVEMEKYLLDSAPYGPTVMESAQQYLNSGAIAVQLAEFIRHLGYSARAHIDGSYRVVCPLVARDAGLGEIGRMGLLMTPELGPRVRIAVVTTDMPLVATERVRDLSMIDFCKRCLKCADVCPSKAISFDKQQEIAGAKRWQINSEACFTYWCTIGTDCAKCMRACPYSHPNNLLHNMVRAGIKRSALFREFALQMDDFFYGRKPPAAPIPKWLNPATN